MTWPVLLARTLLSFSRAYQRLAAAIAGAPTIVQYDNFLRAVPDEGCTIADLARAARVSKRALRSRGGMAVDTLIAKSAGPPRVQIWRLTPDGHRARDVGREVMLAAEDDWFDELGRDSMRRLREALEPFVAGLVLELPHYPMPYGPADGSITGGSYVPSQAGPPRLPSHGADWMPVVRDSGDTVSHLPLHALVSQTLVAYTIEYEGLAGEGLRSTAALRRTFVQSGDDVAYDDAAARLGLTGDGRSGFERHGIVEVLSKGGGRVARLTPRGRTLVDGHDDRMGRVEQLWNQHHGDDVVEAVRTRLQDVASAVSSVPNYVIVRYWRDVSFELAPSR